MRKKAGRFQKKYSLTVLTLLFFSFVSWSVAYSQETENTITKKSHPKIESALFDLQQKYLAQGRGASQAFAQQRYLRIDEQDKVTVFLLPKAGKTRETIDVEALKALGGEVLKSGEAVVKARVPISLLDQVADHVKGVHFIKQPDRPHITAVSEGIALTGASIYQASGYTGANASVAIIDLGFATLSDAIAAGVLPSSVITIDCEGAGCGPADFSSEVEPHGTAVAEIVHEMAPAAQLYLIKIGDNLDLKDAKNYCISNKIRIINHSVGWFVSNFYDGTCYYDNAVCAANHAYKNGILWVNAMGNEGMRHYGATFRDSDGDRLHNVTANSNFIPFEVTENDFDPVFQSFYPIEALLTWDAWPETNQDYDLLLYDSSKSNVVASSTNIQDGTQPPIEGLYFIPPATGTYYLAVRNSNATSNLRFHLFTINYDLDPSVAVASSSLVSPADASGVMAVAAINYTNWSTGPQENFSSQGPTSDGRMKPEVSGPDGTSSFIYPPPYNFLGTSAASPHVAGAAALILSNNPTFTVSQLWNSLTSSAIDLGSVGQDPISGYGRLNLSTIFIDPASVDFGGVMVGSLLESTITVWNIGSPSLTIGAITPPAVPFTLVADSCSGQALHLGSTCTLRIRFSPPSIGDFSSALTVFSNDPSRAATAVPLKGKGMLAVTLSSPSDRFPTGTCTLYNPPVFEWDVNAVITNYEIQFSLNRAFGSTPMKIKTSGTAYGMTLPQWKKVLSMPGPNGGTVYWRVVGTKPDGSLSPSENRSILIAAPQPVGAPVISPVSKNDLPTLTWQNQCNVRFRAWFGSDAFFSRKTSLSFQTSDPSLNGGVFSEELSPDQWSRIRRLVGDQTGSAVYWYVESWDSLNRYAVTGVASFILTD